jgi:hypothetical protein
MIFQLNIKVFAGFLVEYGTLWDNKNKLSIASIDLSLHPEIILANKKKWDKSSFLHEGSAEDGEFMKFLENIFILFIVKRSSCNRF